MEGEIAWRGQVATVTVCAQAFSGGVDRARVVFAGWDSDREPSGAEAIGSKQAMIAERGKVVWVVAVAASGGVLRSRQ